MNTLKIVCATLVIFIAGILTGVVLMRIGERGNRPGMRPNREVANRPQTNLFVPNNPGNRPNPGEGVTPPNAAANQDRNFLQMLDRQIRLTPEQRQQIAQLMAEGQERIARLRQGIEPDIRREMQATHEQIQKLLTPEQQELFQRVMRQRLRRADAAGPGGDRRPREPREFREPRSQFPPPDGPPEGERLEVPVNANPPPPEP